MSSIKDEIVVLLNIIKKFNFLKYLRKRKVLKYINQHCVYFTITEITKETRVKGNVVDEIIRELNKNGFIGNWGCHCGQLILTILPYRVHDFRMFYGLKEIEIK